MWAHDATMWTSYCRSGKRWRRFLPKKFWWCGRLWAWSEGDAPFPELGRKVLLLLCISTFYIAASILKQKINCFFFFLLQGRSKVWKTCPKRPRLVTFPFLCDVMTWNALTYLVLNSVSTSQMLLLQDIFRLITVSQFSSIVQFCRQYTIRNDFKNISFMIIKWTNTGKI